MVSLFADDNAKDHLQYGVKVEGTTKDRNIFIIRFLETSYSPGNKYIIVFCSFVYAISYDAEVKSALFNLHKK